DTFGLTFEGNLADFFDFETVLESFVEHVAYEDLTFLCVGFKTGSSVDCVADGGKVHSEIAAYVSYDCRTAVNAYTEADTSAKSLLELLFDCFAALNDIHSCAYSLVLIVFEIER